MIQTYTDAGNTFIVRINDGHQQELTTRTGIYGEVAVAAIAMLPYEENDGPVIVEVDDQMGEIYTYRIGSSQDGSLIVETHNLQKDRMLIDYCRSIGETNTIPSVLVQYRPPST
jgi:hypothetical protein